MPVIVKGLDEFRRELRRADKRMGKAFQKANKKVSQKVADRGKSAVKGLSSPGGTIAARGYTPSSRSEPGDQIEVATELNPECWPLAEPTNKRRPTYAGRLRS